MNNVPSSGDTRNTPSTKGQEALAIFCLLFNGSDSVTAFQRPTGSRGRAPAAASTSSTPLTSKCCRSLRSSSTASASAVRGPEVLQLPREREPIRPAGRPGWSHCVSSLSEMNLLLLPAIRFLSPVNRGRSQTPFSRPWYVITEKLYQNVALF
jgi:hypothetical protein